MTGNGIAALFTLVAASWGFVINGVNGAAFGAAIGSTVAFSVFILSLKDGR